MKEIKRLIHAEALRGHSKFQDSVADVAIESRVASLGDTAKFPGRGWYVATIQGREPE